MNWARYKLLIVSGVLTIVVGGALGFWWASAASTAGDLARDIQRTRQRQDHLVSRKPYPSEESLERLKTEQEKVRQRRDALTATIRESQVETEPVSRSVFGDYIKEFVPSLRAAAASATRGGESGVILRDPDFGLTRYLEGELPEARRIPQLVVELETMDHLARELFQSGISELVSIDVISDEKEGAAQRTGLFPGALSGGGVRPTPAPAEGTVAEGPKAEVREEIDRMFDVVPIRIEFKVYEDFFWEVLNQLLADSNQVVISRLAVTNENTLLWPQYLEPVFGQSREARSSRSRGRGGARDRSEGTDVLGMLLGGDSDPETGARQPGDRDKLAGLRDRRKLQVGGDLLNVAVELKVYRLKDVPADATSPADTTSPEEA